MKKKKNRTESSTNAANLKPEPLNTDNFPARGYCLAIWFPLFSPHRYRIESPNRNNASRARILTSPPTPRPPFPHHSRSPVQSRTFFESIQNRCDFRVSRRGKGTKTDEAKGREGGVYKNLGSFEEAWK